MPPLSQLNRNIIDCRRCPRLVDHCQKIAREKRRAFRDQDYWGKPVPNLGRQRSPILVVGLAPAAHGANRTGRMFTGDRSGDWLFRAMYRAGLASQPDSRDAADGLRLIDATITAICHCAPPDNRPTREELDRCRDWLEQTIESCRPKVMMALGGLAWTQLARYCESVQWLTKRPRPKFTHGTQVELENGRFLLGSYHPSQQNTFTGRLTESMLDEVFLRARRLAGLDETD